MDAAPPPPGFVLDAPPAAAPTAAPQGAAPTPPPGFVLDGATPAATPAAEPNAAFDPTRAVTQGATGFNEGFASSILRPIDAASNLLNKPAEWITGNAAPSQHLVEDSFRQHFVDPMGDPQNRAEQTLRAGGRMGGENLPVLIGGAGLAGSGIRSGVTMAEQSAPGIVNKVRGAADSVLEGMAANPVASAVGEHVGATEAGAGGNIGRNVAKDSGGDEHAQERAELAGQLLLPTGAAAWSKISPTGLAVKGIAKVGGKVLENVPEAAIPENLRPASGTYADRKAEQLAYSNREGKYENPDVPAPPEGNFATRRMDAGQARRENNASEAASKEFKGIVDQPDAAANLAESQRLEQAIPGFKPGVAKATQDPALLKLQETMESRATGDELRGVQQAHDANVDAIRSHRDSIIPPAEAPRRTPEDVGPQPVTDTPQDSVAGTVGQRVQGVNDKLGAQADAVRGKIQATSDGLPDAERASGGAAFRDIHETAEQASSDRTSELRKAIANPDTPIKVGDKTMTINEALDRRAAINQEQRKYASTVGTVEGADRMAQLSAERSAVDRAIEGVNQPGMKEYRDYYRDEHVPKYQEGAGRDVVRYDRFGYDKNKVPDEKVLAQFGGPNNISAAKQFTATHGENPAAVQLMADHQLGRLKAEALDGEGAIKAGAVDKFLTKNRELLDALPPAVRDAVKTKNPDDLYGRLGQIEQRQRAVADTKVAKLFTQGKNPEQHIDAALNDWQVMKGLKNSVRGDPQAEAALRRAVIDRAPDPMDAGKFDAWLKGNDRSLRQVLAPDHLKALQDVLSAAKVNNQLPRPTGTVDLPGSLADKGAKVLGITVPSLLQRVLSVKQGRMSAEYGVADVGVRALRQFSNREIESAWKEALYNPKVAKDLQLMVKGGTTPIQLARMRNYMLSVGLHDTEDRAQH